MTNVLVVKANHRPDGVSTKMYETFIAEAATIEGLNVTTFDVFEEDMPYFGQDLFNAFGKVQAGEQLTDVESRILAAKQKSMDAVAAADVVVFAFPLWNLTIPAPLQTFIDYTMQAGFSFKYNEQGQLVQLLTNKKAILLNARGGVYSTPEAAPMDMAVNYVRAVVTGFFGMEVIEEVIIEGHNADRENAATIIPAGIENVKVAAQKLAKVTA